MLCFFRTTCHLSPGHLPPGTWNAKTMGKWGIPEKSFENVFQLRWPYLRRTHQSKVIAGNHFLRRRGGVSRGGDNVLCFPFYVFLPKNGSYTSARMFPAEIQPWSTQYNQFGDTRGASGRIYLIYSILRPFLAIKIVQKTTTKIGSSWISIYLNHRDHLKPLVHFINKLFLDPPP